MDIEGELLGLNSRKTWDKVIDYVGEDVERFDELMQLFLNGEMRTVQRASQPIGVIGERIPRLIKPYLPDLVGYLKSDPIDAVKRNTMRIFQFIDIPEDIEGDLFEIGMNFLKSAEEPVAVKAFTMTALRKIAEKYPELAQEVIFQIEILVKERVSTGLTNRGQHELKKLAKIVEQL